MLPDIKVSLISDATTFALTDVFNGYKNALTKFKIPFEAYPYHLLRKLLSDEQCYHNVHSNCLIKSKGFTHIFFIGGLSMPEFLFDSLYDKKSVVIATEDPHTFDPLKYKLPMIDYYFSNERSIGDCKRLKNTYYCPTAGCDQECGKLPLKALEEKYHSDILFLGAMYPNRIKLLEAIVPLVEKYDLNFKICGHVHYMPKTSPLWKYVAESSTVRHEDTVKYYNGAKVVINMMRDVKWKPPRPGSPSQKNRANKSRFVAESLNPRAYEVPLCQSFMLMEDIRSEAHDVYTKDEVGFFSDEKSLIQKLKYYLVGKGKDKREEMAFRAYRKAALHHTYSKRLEYILSIINPA